MAHAEAMRLSAPLLTLALGLLLAPPASDPPLRVVESLDLTRYAQILF